MMKNDKKESLKKFNPTFFLALATLVLVLGFVSGYFLGAGRREEAFQKGLAQGKEEVEEYYIERIKKVFPPSSEGEKKFTVIGEVTHISDKTLVVKERTTNNPIERPRFKEWTVEATENTNVFKEEVVNSPEKEVTDGRIQKIEKEFDDLKEGQRVKIWAESDIKGKQEFKATEISFGEI